MLEEIKLAFGVRVIFVVFVRLRVAPVVGIEVSRLTGSIIRRKTDRGKKGLAVLHDCGLKTDKGKRLAVLNDCVGVDCLSRL